MSIRLSTRIDAVFGQHSLTFGIHMFWVFWFDVGATDEDPMAKTRLSGYDIMRVFFGGFLALQHPAKCAGFSPAPVPLIDTVFHRSQFPSRYR
jgi:hypothetical protein